jgi:F420-non-reducing hydrogenase iron-sulfur subunit
VEQFCVFACQNRVPEDWRPPFAPDEIGGHKVRLIQLPCSAKLGTIHMLRPFEKGVDGVLVMTCSEDGCQSLEGSRRARMRVREANRALDEIGLGCCRVMIKQGGGQDRDVYFAAIEELTAQTEKVGPNPIRGNGNV